MTVYDQEKDAAPVAGKAGTTEIAVPLDFPAALADYHPRSKTEATFLSLLAGEQWLDTDEAGLRLALQIAEGDADAAGQSIETRSVKNLKLANKVHTVTDFTLARSSFYDETDPRSCPIYAVVEAADADGQVFSYSNGSWKPLGQLYAKRKGGALPWKCLIAEIAVKSGNAAYSYVDA